MIERVFEEEKNNSKAMLSVNEEKNRGMVRIKERILLTDQTHTEEREKKINGSAQGRISKTNPSKSCEAQTSDAGFGWVWSIFSATVSVGVADWKILLLIASIHCCARLPSTLCINERN